MFRDVETIRQWTRVALTIAAFPVTAFPLLYLVFSPWYKSQLGRAMMLQSLSIALAVGFSVAYQELVSPTNLYELVLIRFLMFVFFGASSFYLLTVLIILNFVRPKKVRNTNVKHPSGLDGRQESAPE